MQTSITVPPVIFAAAAIVALFSATTGAAVLLGWLPTRRRRETLGLSRRSLWRRGLGHSVEGVAGLVWSVGSLVHPGETVPLAYSMLPLWVLGGVLVISTQTTRRAPAQTSAVVDHDSAPLRRRLFWLSLANLAVATAGLVLVYAAVPHGIFKALAAGFSIAALLIDGLALACYAAVFRWNTPFRRVQASFVSVGVIAGLTVFLVILAVGVSRAVPPPAFPLQEAVLAIVTLATMGIVAWDVLMYRQMLRDGGWKELNRPGSVVAP